MAKAKFKDEESLLIAKQKNCGAVIYRQMKNGRVIGSKWPNRRKKSKK